MAIIGDLEPIYRGEDVVLTIDMPEDITGWDIRMYLVDPVTGTEIWASGAASITNALTGVCQIAVSAAVSMAWAARLHWYEVRRVNVGSVAVLRTGNIPVWDSPHTRTG